MHISKHYYRTFSYVLELRLDDARRSKVSAKQTLKILMQIDGKNIVIRPKS